MCHFPTTMSLKRAQLHGGIAVAAHPGRRRIGMLEPVREPPLTLETVQVAEVLNGASSDQESTRSQPRSLRIVGCAPWVAATPTSSARLRGAAPLSRCR